MRRLQASRGFSLVELLVAMVFTMLLMAGMATVFKGMLTTSYSSGEKLSSLRRNRASLDLLYDDLNTAGMSLVDFSSALATGTTNPAFYIIPNAVITNARAVDPQTTDELYMAFDQPMAFDGTLVSGGGAGSVGKTAPQDVVAGIAMDQTSGTDSTYIIECGDASYASSVKPGMAMRIKDSMSDAAFTIATAAPTGTQVKVTTATAPSLATQVTGRGDPGTLRSFQRITSSGVVFILPTQMVRYRIVMLKLDPQSAVGIPCLVREQGNYDGNAAFTVASTQVIAENVSGFKAYLSANSGASWAGTGVTATGLLSGWTNGIQAALDAQLSGNATATPPVPAAGRKDFQATAGNSSWYRDIPILVRLDITTRTATQRTEFSADQKSLAYRDLTQSLVIVPRHFGLSQRY